MQQGIILAYLQNINFYRAQSTKRPWWPWVASHGIPSHRCLWAQECYSLPVLSCTVGIPAFQPLFLPNGPPWAHLAYRLPLTSWRFWMDPVTSPSLCIPCSDPVQLCPAGGCTVHTGCQAPISPFSKQGVSPTAPWWKYIFGSNDYWEWMVQSALNLFISGSTWQSFVNVSFFFFFTTLLFRRSREDHQGVGSGIETMTLWPFCLEKNAKLKLAPTCSVSVRFAQFCFLVQNHSSISTAMSRGEQVLAVLNRNESLNQNAF